MFARTLGSKRIETNCDPASRVTPMNIASALALQSRAEVDQPLDIQSRHCLIYEGVSSPRPFARLFSMITKSYDKNLMITVNIYLNSYIVD